MARKKSSMGDMSGRLNVRKKKKSVQTEDSRPNDQKLAAYRLGSELKERIDQVAKELNVQKSDLVRYLLSYSLNQLEAGEITIETADANKPQKIVLIG